MRKKIIRLFAKLGLNDYCPIHIIKTIPEGYYGEYGYCPKCRALEKRRKPIKKGFI